MFAIIFAGLVAVCTAAPLDDLTPTQPPNALETHVVNKYSTSLNSSEIAKTEEFQPMVAQFYNKFPPGQTTQGVQGDEYKIAMPVNDLEEKDVVIITLEGALIVQAVDNQTKNKKNYIDFRLLPACVNVAGNWTIENGVLEVVFPLIPGKVCEEVAKVPTTFAKAMTESTDSSQNPQNTIDVEVASFVTVNVNGQPQLVPIVFTEKII